MRDGERTFAENLPEVVNVDALPESIRINGDALPESIRINIDALPESIRIDGDALPESIRIDGDLPEIRYTESDAGTLAEFFVPAGGQQRLDVRSLLRDGDMKVVSWKKVHSGEWKNDDPITLADIDDIISLAEID